MADAIRALTVRDVLQLGGWGTVPSARVRALATFGEYAFSVTDTNSDGVEMDNESWCFVDGGWQNNGRHGATLHRTGRAYLGQESDQRFVEFRLASDDADVDLDAVHVGTWQELPTSDG